MPFCPFYLSGSDALRDLDLEFGILPVPKLDENQENYRAFSCGGMVVVPANLTNPDMTGAVIEALYATAHKYIPDAVLMFGRTLIDYAVPSALLYAVPVGIAGTYNAWRMILHNAGTLLATTLAGFLPLPLMVGITVVCQLLSGWNFLTAKIMRRTL